MWMEFNRGRNRDGWMDMTDCARERERERERNDETERDRVREREKEVMP